MSGRGAHGPVRSARDDVCAAPEQVSGGRQVALPHGAADGMVSAEVAVALPALVLVALLALRGVQVVRAEMRCRDAASVAARLAAGGETRAAVSAAATAAAPHGARLRLS